jgi:cellulose synthase/poly-beta-1,6-N-acetylglucosamine synthase-like glycosyltransferase
VIVTFLAAIHVAGVAGLALYGLLGFLTLALYLRHCRDGPPPPSLTDSPLPFITVQLPLFNERDVVRRLVNAAAALDYPRDRLQIQVLDDSTDDTTALAAQCVTEWQAQGLDIVLLHREHRQGFKAGALAEALESTRGELIAVFDADFVPRPDFLRRTIPFFRLDARLGMVQARWGHLNASDSALTGAQAMALDKHFAVEQLVRHRANCFPKFNGSAGIWRRACIADAGGWQADTVCEDLCLSTRAVLAGWRFYYAGEVVAPAELPATILAYKSQQARWAMGATQCLTKYAAPIWRAREYSLLARLYALLSMSAYMTHLLLLALLLVQLPLLLYGYRLPGWLLIFTLLGLGQPVLFVLAQRALYPDWVRRMADLPALLLIAVGTAPSNAKGILHGLFGRDFTFTRTPKGGNRSYRMRVDPLLLVELALACYSAVTLALALGQGHTGSALLPLTGALGLGYVALLSLRESLPASWAAAWLALLRSIL